MVFPHSYYDDEVKCDFYVPSMVKRTWAAGVQILSDIDSVCRKNNIQYFAEWGTLLGTIRHGGYIPWDDDLDICMKRADYNRFLSIAKKELPEGYDIVSYKTSKIYKQMLCRVVNSDHYRFDKEFLNKFSGLPFAMGIDIFPLDYLTDDESYEQNRREKVHFILNTIDDIEKNNAQANSISNALDIIERNCHIHLHRREDIPFQLRKLLEKLYSEVPEEKASFITTYEIWFNHSTYKQPKSYYNHSIRLPFENTTIPVPLYYNNVLSKNYSKSYMIPMRSGGAHNYPYFQMHIDVLKEHFNYEWPTYRFDTAKLLSDRDRGIGFSQFFDCTLSELDTFHSQIRSACISEDYDELVNLATNCQNTAITLGNTIEQRYFEGSKTVGILELYCEKLYELCTFVTSGSSNTKNILKLIDELSDTTSYLPSQFNDELAKYQIVLFICPNAKYFSSLQNTIESYRQSPDCIVKIMPIPRIEISPDMTSSNVVFDISDYPSNEVYTDYSTFSLEVHPDVIVYNYPYDEYNILSTTENTYYSNNLFVNSDKLIYVPFNTVSTIKSDDERSVINLKYALCSPLVAACDEIHLFDEDTKSQYIEALVSYTSESLREYWSSKIKVKTTDNTDKTTNTSSVPSDFPAQKKKLLYFLGINSFLSYSNNIINKINSVLEIFKSNSDSLDIIFVEQMSLTEALGVTYPEILSQYLLIKNKISDMSNVEIGNPALLPSYYASICDAYYGEASLYVPEFNSLNKTVMYHNPNIL